MKKAAACLLILMFTVVVSNAQNKEEQQICKAMEIQTQCWNKGDIDGFMQTYWQSDSLLFTGKSGPTYGWQQTLDNYKKHYPDTASMGKLQFNLLQLKPLSAKYYFVLGKWDLERTIGNIGGYFTLLFKKINGRWLIVADHSS